MREEWKDIDGYEGYYQVSNCGRVKSLARKMWNGYVWWWSPEKILKERVSKGKIGYSSVCLRKDGVSKTKNIHRLVATAFVETTDCSLYVNHKDENKLNNHYTNLEWVTPSENLNYGENQKRKGDKRFVKVCGTHVETGHKIILETLEQTNSLGFNKSAISHVICGRHKTHKGYTWQSL